MHFPVFCTMLYICQRISLVRIYLSTAILIKVSIILAQPHSPPIIPIGEDAYLQWHLLPYQRIGVRAYMRSTYDREGNNRRADASHYLYQDSETFNVTLDAQGPGILYFKRTNFFHGSPWHYEVDGIDFIVKETATDDPIDIKTKYLNPTFIPEKTISSSAYVDLGNYERRRFDVGTYCI